MTASGQHPSSGRGASTRPRRGGKGATRQPNRAQLRAMQARAAATGSPASQPGNGETSAVAPMSAAATTRRERAPSGRRSRPVARPIALSREDEYRYIRSDLNRLALTAGGLLAMMILLLIIL